MNILLVNDDSIHAPGIQMLARAASQLGDVWVVAPADQCSAMSQKLTLREPMTLREIDVFPAKVKAAWEVGGTPVDCVKVALYHILEEKPDLVLSGINNGYNAGYDINYSGTLGAALEAVRNGIPAMAFSAAGDGHLPWVEPYLVPLMQALLERTLEPGSVWNVNFPPMKDGKAKEILWDRATAPTSMYLEQYIRSEEPDGSIWLSCHGIPTPDDQIPDGTDAAALRSGYISVGQIKSAG